MPRTAKVVEDRRKQIIEAAMRVFAQKGFARATNRDVAQEAEITTGLIYYYFKSKEDLLGAVLEEYSPARLATQVSPEMLEQPPEVFLPQLMMRVFSLIESEEFLSIIRVLMPEMLHGAGEIAPIVSDFFQRLVDFVGQYLQIQLATGHLRADLNVEMTTQLLVSSVVGVVMRRQIMRDPRMLNYTHEEIAQAVLGTILPDMLA
jgi:AcrR family transcriptional regulator